LMAAGGPMKRTLSSVWRFFVRTNIGEFHKSDDFIICPPDGNAGWPALFQVTVMQAA